MICPSFITENAQPGDAGLFHLANNSSTFDAVEGGCAGSPAFWAVTRGVAEDNNNNDNETTKIDRVIAYPLI
jgi:hypothetical protein